MFGDIPKIPVLKINKFQQVQGHSTMSLDIVTRSEWGAEPSRSILTLFHPVPSVFVTFSGQEPCYDDDQCLYAIRQMQYINIYQNKQPDVMFNFAIGGNNKVYEGRGWYVSPTLPIRYLEYTRCSLLITYFGNYYDTNVPETPEMQEVLEKLLKYGVTNKLIHRKLLQYNF